MHQKIITISQRFLSKTISSNNAPKSENKRRSNKVNKHGVALKSKRVYS